MEQIDSVRIAAFADGGNVMGEYRMEGEVEIPADALWSVVSDFADVSWVPGKPARENEGEGIGMVRVINTPPIPAVREQLDAIDEAERTIRYRVIEGNPMPLSDYRAAMQVVDLGDGRSRLVWSCSFEPAGVSEDQARKTVAGMYKAVFAAMKANLESR
jgi:hypothetical protein